MEEDRGVNLAFNRRRRGGEGDELAKGCGVFRRLHATARFSKREGERKGKVCSDPWRGTSNRVCGSRFKDSRAERRVHVAVHGEI